jgi:3-phosphoshikimate 1-carboxyvinyltransferase
MMIRAVAAGFLCEGDTLINNPSFCDDALAALDIVKFLGAEVISQGHDLRITGRKILIGRTHLDCSESGLCLRMFIPIAALFEEEIILEGKGSLLTRPVGKVEIPMNHLGCSCNTNNDRPPVKVKGPLKGGNVHIDGSQSSQFLTGLLMALPLCENDSEITVFKLQSKPYIAMTLSLLKEFGITVDHEEDFGRFRIKGTQNYRRGGYTIEGDWSSASFFLVAGAVGGFIRITGLSLQSLQADKKILEALELAGAKIIIKDNLVAVEHNDLKAFDFDATHCPDLFPSLVVFACSCEGRSVIHGVERLFFKESNRAAVLLSEFQKIGAIIEIEGDRMIVEGGNLEGGLIDSYGDHRIAMAGALAGMASKNGVIINNWQSVSKSYPTFFDDLEIISRRAN